MSCEIRKCETVGILKRNGKIPISESSLLDMIKRNADVLMIATMWRKFCGPDFGAIKAVLKQFVIFERQNLYASAKLNEEGFEYDAINRKV